DFAVGNQLAENLAAFGARAGIVDVEGFAAPEIALGGSGWAGASGLVLLGPQGQNRNGNHQKYGKTDEHFAHGTFLRRKKIARSQTLSVAQHRSDADLFE